jgi:hypothetical protein
MITRADMETIIAVLAPVLAGNLAERLAPIEAELALLKAGALVPSNEAEACEPLRQEISYLRQRVAALEREQ